MKLRHKTTEAVIGGAQWNEDHVTPAYEIGNLGAAVTIDPENGLTQTGVVNANVTITLSSITAWMAEHLTLILTNDGGPWAMDVANVTWVDGEAPELDVADNARNILVFTGTNGEGWIGDGGSA